MLYSDSNLGFTGEILRLNPGYKAPADYKPLLKEAKVPIPVSIVAILFKPFIFWWLDPLADVIHRGSSNLCSSPDFIYRCYMHRRCWLLPPFELLPSLFLKK